MPKASSKRAVNEKKGKIPVEVTNVEKETEQVNGDVNLNATYNVPVETNLKEPNTVEKEMDKDDEVPEEKLNDIDEPVEEEIAVSENGVTSTNDNDDEEKAPDVKSKKVTKKMKPVPTENGSTSPKRADKGKSADMPPTKRGRPARMASSKDKAAPKKEKAKIVPESEQEDDTKMENETDDSAKTAKRAAKKNNQETKKKPNKAKELAKPDGDEHVTEELENDENNAESDDKPKAEPKKRGRKPKETSKASENNVVEKPVRKTKTTRKKAN